MSATPMTLVPNVAEVVEAEWAEGGSVEGGSVALGERRAVEVAADDAAEDEVVLVGEVLSLTEPCERLGDLGRHRDRADLA